MPSARARRIAAKRRSMLGQVGVRARRTASSSVSTVIESQANGSSASRSKIALDERGARLQQQQPDRQLAEHLENRAGDAVLRLGGLVRVRCRAHEDRGLRRGAGWRSSSRRSASAAFVLTRSHWPQGAFGEAPDRRLGDVAVDPAAAIAEGAARVRVERVRERGQVAAGGRQQPARRREFDLDPRWCSHGRMVARVRPAAW